MAVLVLLLATKALVSEAGSRRKGSFGDPAKPPPRRKARRRRAGPSFALIARTMTVAILLMINAGSVFLGSAAGESKSELQARMDSIQARLDDTTARIEALRTQKDNVEHRISDIHQRIGRLSDRQARLQAQVAERAEELYKSGTSTMVATLLAADSLAEVMDRAEGLSQVSMSDTSVFIELARSQDELASLDDELAAQRDELAVATEGVVNESGRLQSQLEAVKGQWARLTRRLAPSMPTTSGAAPVLRSTDGMYCPVAGPHSFVDSWGAPRSGHNHQGVDMMAAYGTPIVAIVSGTITYAAYDGSGGNMIFLSGDDGNAYWYMHNQENLVSGGHVQAGQQIATVGDTGNAAGTPHLHFEYHPGGGAAVNPTPLVASIC